LYMAYIVASPSDPTAPGSPQELLFVGRAVPDPTLLTNHIHEFFHLLCSQA
jgi:hypothetical protein